MPADLVARTTATAKEDSALQLTLRFSVADRSALWRAAVQRCVGISGLSPDDVYETLGPPDDPAIEDCLMMLLIPSVAEGCVVEDYQLQPVVDRSALYSGETPLPAPRVPLEAISGLFDGRHPVAPSTVF